MADGEDGGAVSAITKAFPDVGYDLIARLPAGMLAVGLGLWLAGADLAAMASWELTWPPAVAILLLLFPLLHTIGVLVSAVSWTFVAWWFRPLVYRWLPRTKAGVPRKDWRRANALELDAFRRARRSNDRFVPLLTKSRAEMALATNLLSTYLLMSLVGLIQGAPAVYSRLWLGVGALLLLATWSRTRSYFAWLFTD
jgi:hypothetical protein